MKYAAIVYIVYYCMLTMYAMCTHGANALLYMYALNKQISFYSRHAIVSIKSASWMRSSGQC